MTGKSGQCLSGQPVTSRVLDKNRDEIPYSSGLQRTVLLPDHVLDSVPGNVRKFRVQPLNNAIEGPQLFTNSHRPIVTCHRQEVNP